MVVAMSRTGRSKPKSTRRTMPLIAVGATCFAVVVAGLSLSDRAPGFLRHWMKRVGRAGESRSGFDFFDRADIPYEFDQVGHFFLWGLAGLLAWFALGRKVSGPLIVVGLAAVSAGVEFVQPILSSTRAASRGDLQANVLGIVLGVTAAWLVVSSYRAFGWVRNRLA